MKKLKTLGAISFALIGGGALVSIPLALTSCKKKGEPKVDQYITWEKGPYHLGSSQASQISGVKIGERKDVNDMILGQCNKASIGPAWEGHIYIISLGSDDKDILLTNLGSAIPTGSHTLSFEIVVSSNGKEIEQMLWMCSLIIDA